MNRAIRLRGYHCDSARISNIRFENLRIDGVLFKNIRAVADPLRAELRGFGDTHAVSATVLSEHKRSRKLLPVRKN